MLYGLDDIRMRRSFIDQEGGDADHTAREHKRLDALLAFCEAPSCRRQSLLSYFGEHIEPCNNCDICLDPPQLKDGTVQACVLSKWPKPQARCSGRSILLMCCAA